MLRFRTKIVFEGLNISRTINKLSQIYVIYDIVRKGKQCEITVKSSVLNKVIAYLKEKCYNIIEIRNLGASSLKEFAQKHFLLPIFALIAVALIVLSSNFCWKIEVVGDFSEAQVLQALKQCDVGIGTSLYNYSADILENKLSTQLDAMYAVVTRKGSVLYVNAVQKKQAEESVDMHTRRDIIATCSGKVVNVLCEQGTALVGVGDTVQVGDVLIVGLRYFNDGTAEDVYALGIITVQQSCTAFVQFDGTVTETVDTGNVFVSNHVELFGQSYGKVPQFENFRVESKQTQLFPLNLTIERMYFYEVEQVTTSATLEECLDKLKTQALSEALSQAQFVVKFVEYKVDNGVYATVFGETIIS